MGGLMIYGIPSFKLEKEVVIRRSDLLEERGVVYHPDTEAGAGVELDELRSGPDAVLNATGVKNARDIMCPCIGLDGIHPALYRLETRGVGKKWLSTVKTSVSPSYLKKSI